MSNLPKTFESFSDIQNTPQQHWHKSNENKHASFFQSPFSQNIYEDKERVQNHQQSSQFLRIKLQAISNFCFGNSHRKQTIQPYQTQTAQEKQAKKDFTYKKLEIQHQNQFHSNSAKRLIEVEKNQPFMNSLYPIFRKKYMGIDESKLPKVSQSTNNKIKTVKSQPKINSLNQERSIEMLKAKVRQNASLKQKLKNIHIFYRIKIQEEKKQKLKNDAVFLDLVQENNQIHQEKMYFISQLVHAKSNRNFCMNSKQQQQIQKNSSSTKSLFIEQKLKEETTNTKILADLFKSKERIEQKSKLINQLLTQKKLLKDEVQIYFNNSLNIEKWRAQLSSVIAKGEQKIQHLKKALQLQDQYY